MTPEQLRDWRTSRRVSQPELADLLDVRSNTVWRWEAGVNGIPGFLRLALDHLDLLHGYRWNRGPVDEPRALPHRSAAQQAADRLDAQNRLKAASNVMAMRHPQEIR